MLRVWVEVDRGLCVLSGVDGVDEGRGQGDWVACLARGVIMRGLGRGVLVLWMAENNVFLFLDAREDARGREG
jgi:hypothetical protein